MSKKPAKSTTPTQSAATAVDDLFDAVGKTATDPKKKSPEITITDPKMIDKLLQWRKAKSDEETAKGMRDEAETDIAPITIKSVKEEIAKAGKAIPSVTIVFFEDLKDGSDPIRHVINVSCNKDQWSKIAEGSIEELKTLFKDKFDLCFEKDRSVELTEAAMKEPQVIQDILEKVFGGDRNKFAKYFSVTTVFKPKTYLWERQYLDQDLGKIVQEAKDKGLIAQYKPAFSSKG